MNGQRADKRNRNQSDKQRLTGLAAELLSGCHLVDFDGHPIEVRNLTTKR